MTWTIMNYGNKISVFHDYVIYVALWPGQVDLLRRGAVVLSAEDVASCILSRKMESVW